MKNEELEAKALAWCNARRQEKGKRPLKKMPKGRQQDQMSCPCGRTCKLWVDSLVWKFCDDPVYAKNRPLPKYMQRFVEKFDEGEFPHLIERKSK